MHDVAVLGIGMSPFVGVTDQSLRAQSYLAGARALEDAGIGFEQVKRVYTAFIFEPTMAGVRFTKEFGLTGIPVQRIENASATGSAALHEAVLAVSGGHADIVMVLGFDDMQKNVSVGMTKDSTDGVILPAAFFALWAKDRMKEYGTSAETLAKIAAKNWNNGALNPMAQRQPKNPITPAKILASKMISDPLTSMMAAGVGQGAAAVIVARADLARKLHPDRPQVVIRASVLESERYTEHHLFAGPVVGPQAMTRSAARAAYEQAAVGPEDIDLVQVHDAFPIEELLYYELLGFCADGEGDQLVKEGATQIGGRIPFSTDGGLIGRGHPGGPTGLAQIWETTHQLRGTAGPRQVEGAQLGMCHMVGGGSVCVIHLLERQ
ncbi:MAG TPA: thiolase family protein [Amycolatopsis sp.]|nr:thiolase family protein [Amycolatopsis sp.]